MLILVGIVELRYQYAMLNVSPACQKSKNGNWLDSVSCCLDFRQAEETFNMEDDVPFPQVLEQICEICVKKPISNSS